MAELTTTVVFDNPIPHEVQTITVKEAISLGITDIRVIAPKGEDIKVHMRVAFYDADSNILSEQRMENFSLSDPVLYHLKLALEIALQELIDEGVLPPGSVVSQ